MKSVEQEDVFGRNHFLSGGLTHCCSPLLFEIDIHEKINYTHFIRIMPPAQLLLGIFWTQAH